MGETRVIHSRSNQGTHNSSSLESAMAPAIQVANGSAILYRDGFEDFGTHRCRTMPRGVVSLSRLSLVSLVPDPGVVARVTKPRTTLPFESIPFKPSQTYIIQFDTWTRIHRCAYSEENHDDEDFALVSETTWCFGVGFPRQRTSDALSDSFEWNIDWSLGSDAGFSVPEDVHVDHRVEGTRHEVRVGVRMGRHAHHLRDRLLVYRIAGVSNRWCIESLVVWPPCSLVRPLLCLLVCSQAVPSRSFNIIGRRSSPARPRLRAW